MGFIGNKKIQRKIWIYRKRCGFIEFIDLSHGHVLVITGYFHGAIHEP